MTISTARKATRKSKKKIIQTLTFNWVINIWLNTTKLPIHHPPIKSDHHPVLVLLLLLFVYTLHWMVYGVCCTGKHMRGCLLASYHPFVKVTHFFRNDRMNERKSRKYKSQQQAYRSLLFFVIAFGWLFLFLCMQRFVVIWSDQMLKFEHFC